MDHLFVIAACLVVFAGLVLYAAGAGNLSLLAATLGAVALLLVVISAE